MLLVINSGALAPFTRSDAPTHFVSKSANAVTAMTTAGTSRTKSCVLAQLTSSSVLVVSASEECCSAMGTLTATMDLTRRTVAVRRRPSSPAITDSASQRVVFAMGSINVEMLLTKSTVAANLMSSNALMALVCIHPPGAMVRSEFSIHKILLRDLEL